MENLEWGSRAGFKSFIMSTCFYNPSNFFYSIIILGFSFLFLNGSLSCCCILRLSEHLKVYDSVGRSINHIIMPLHLYFKMPSRCPCKEVFSW